MTEAWLYYLHFAAYKIEAQTRGVSVQLHIAELEFKPREYNLVACCNTELDGIKHQGKATEHFLVSSLIVHPTTNLSSDLLA